MDQLDPSAKRAAKIEQFKANKALTSQLAALEDKRRKANKSPEQVRGSTMIVCAAVQKRNALSFVLLLPNNLAQNHACVSAIAARNLVRAICAQALAFSCLPLQEDGDHGTGTGGLGAWDEEDERMLWGATVQQVRLLC